MNPGRLAADLAELISNPLRVADAAAAAMLIGRPYAADKLADLVETVAEQKPFKGGASA
jgi:hypothetical protein